MSSLHPFSRSATAATAALSLVVSIACSAASLPDGPYLRSEFSGGQLSNVLFVFKGGKVASNARGNLDNFDFAAHQAKAPKNIGTYTTSGDTLSITWADGSKAEGKVKPDRAGGFDFRSAGYAPVKPLAKGASLNGRFYGGASGGGATVAFDYTFKPDGTYTTKGAGSVSGTTAKSSVSATSTNANAGKYSVSGSQMTLTPASGAARTHFIYYVPTSAGDKAPDMLIIDGVVATKART